MSCALLFKQMARYGSGRMRLARKHPATLGIGTIIPPVFALGLVALPLLAFLSSVFGYLFLVLYGFYLAAVLVSSAAISGRHGVAHIVLAPPIYVAIHLGLGYGFMKEFLIGRRDRPRENPQ